MQKVIRMIKAKASDEEFMHDLGRFVLGNEQVERDNKHSQSATKIRIGSAKANGVVLSDTLEKKADDKGKWGLRKDMNVQVSKDKVKTTVSHEEVGL